MFANLPTRRFGVEIEFVGCDPVQACRAIIAAGVACNAESYNHDVRASWKIVPDGSVSVSPGMAYDACGELVSPPLSGVEGLEEVRRVLAALVSVGGTVNRTCGLHVHLDGADLSPAMIATVLRRYATFQAGIDAFMPASRRGSRWADRITPDLIAGVERCADRAALRNVAGRFDRYRAINVAAFARHGTIEFRQHSGSVNGGKVARWVAFALFFVAASIAGTVAAPTVATVAPVPTVAGRGRRPNFAARRAVVDQLSQGATLAGVAARSGYTPGTLQVSILGALRGMGRLTTRGGLYHFTVTNPAALAAWLGNAAAPVATVAAAPVSSTPDTLWRGIPTELSGYYSERAMDLDPRP